MTARSRFAFAFGASGPPSLVALCFVVLLCAQDATVIARDAWVRVPAPSTKVTALYMVLENSSSRPRAVVFASSEIADKVEMHEMKIMKAAMAGEKESNMGSMKMGMASSRTMMVMTPVAQITIPGKGRTAISPGGLHMMLFGLKSSLAPGDKVTVTLKLDDGTVVPVTAAVRN